MLYVIDNGMRYTDHTVYFAETDLQPSEVDEMIKMANAEGYYEYKVVFITDVLEWRDLSARCSIHDALYFHGAMTYWLEHESTERIIASLESTGLGSGWHYFKDAVAALLKRGVKVSVDINGKVVVEHVPHNEVEREST